MKGGRIEAGLFGMSAIGSLLYVSAMVASIAAAGVAIGLASTAYVRVNRIVIPETPEIPVGIEPAAPFRTLFVAKSWPDNYTTPTYFTTISGAVDQSAELVANGTMPVVIVIYPGRYDEDIGIPSYTLLEGREPRFTQITGYVEWIAGSGINEDFAGADEYISIKGLTITGTFTVTTSSKTTAFTSNAYLYNTEFRDPAVFTFRASEDDNVFVENSQFTDTVNVTEGDFTVYSSKFSTTLSVGGAGTWTVYSSFIDTQAVSGSGAWNTYSSVLDTVTLSGSGSWNIYGSIIGSLTATGTKTVTLDGTVATSVSMGNGTALTGRYCDIVTLTTDTTGTSNIRGCTYTTLAGAGAVDRMFWTTSVTNAVAGANTVTISPPYTVTTYFATFTQRNGTGQAVTLTTKNVASLIFTDAAGAHQYDILLTLK